MNHNGGWMDGWSSNGMWIWMIIATAAVLLFAVMIVKFVKK